jgi:hypothetical protein
MHQTTHAAIIRFSVSYYAHASTHSSYKKAGANPGSIDCVLQLVLVASLVKYHRGDGQFDRSRVGVNEALCF